MSNAGLQKWLMLTFAVCTMRFVEQYTASIFCPRLW